VIKKRKVNALLSRRRSKKKKSYCVAAAPRWTMKKFATAAMVFREMFWISWMWLLWTRTVVTNRWNSLGLRLLHL
jgi:hypothetical protein